jgi:hypothetical protein
MFAQEDHIIVQFSPLGAGFLPGQTSPAAIISPLSALEVDAVLFDFAGTGGSLGWHGLLHCFKNSGKRLLCLVSSRVTEAEPFWKKEL